MKFNVIDAKTRDDATRAVTKGIERGIARAKERENRLGPTAEEQRAAGEKWVARQEAAVRMEAALARRKAPR